MTTSTKQTKIAGPQFEDSPHIKEVSTAATKYAEAKEETASARTAEKRRREELITKMQKHDRKEYTDRGIGLRVLLETDNHLKVTKLGRGGDEPE